MDTNPNQVVSPPLAPQSQASTSMTAKITIIILIIILIAGAAGGFYFIKTKDSQISKLNAELTDANNSLTQANAKISQLTDPKLTNLDLSKFQQVTLTSQADNNGAALGTSNNVYYGKIINYNQNYIVLDDVYYITQPVPNAISLVKRGTELGGTKDPMTINLANIVSIETLKDSSQVLAAINNYIQTQKK